MTVLRTAEIDPRSFHMHVISWLGSSCACNKLSWEACGQCSTSEHVVASQLQAICPHRTISNLCFRTKQSEALCKVVISLWYPGSNISSFLVRSQRQNWKQLTRLLSAAVFCLPNGFEFAPFQTPMKVVDWYCLKRSDQMLMNPRYIWSAFFWSKIFKSWDLNFRTTCHQYSSHRSNLNNHDLQSDAILDARHALWQFILTL